VEGGIERSLREVQSAAGRFRETPGDEVSVGGSGGNYCEKKEIQVAFESFFIHT
jgi:hypothetical protein